MVKNFMLTQLCLAFGKDMKAKRGPYPKCRLALVGVSPARFFGAYSATKVYPNAFRVALARELACYAVKASALCSGLPKPRFWGRADSKHESAGHEQVGARLHAHFGLDGRRWMQRLV